MKITCQSCQAKYTIADEKVVGKTVKIKCKKCGAAIVVNANEASAGDAHGHEPEEDDGATRVFSGDPATEGPMAGAAGGGPDWTVNVADDDQRTMSSAQIAAAFAAGTITGDTYVWRDGMADWQPLSQVAELRSVMAAPAPAPAAAAPVPPPTDDDLNATVAMNPDAAAAHYGMSAPAAAPAAAAPTAARKAAAGRGGQDLFGGGGGASPFDAGAAGSGPGVSPLQKSLDQKAVGERNENSVLFSLASLTATEKAAAAPDLGPSKKKPARSGLDDIMSMGGGGGMGAGMLAPPPIMAPVIEPPPQQIMAPTPAPMPTAMGGSMPPPAAAQPMGGGLISIPPPAQKKTPVGLIIGIVVGVLALGGVGVYLATSGGGDKEATGENGAASASVATTTTTAAPTNTTTDAPKPTETVAANNTAATNTAAPAGGDPGATKTSSGGTAPAGTGTGKPSGTSTATTPTSTAATPPPTATATAETPPAGGGAEFNRAAASSALNAAAGAAKGCKKADGPTGQAKVKVTFAPSGNVTTSQVQGAPFAGTPVGGCIAAAFRSAKVPPFEGSPVSVSKSVTIN